MTAVKDRCDGAAASRERSVHATAVVEAPKILPLRSSRVVFAADYMRFGFMRPSSQAREF